MKKLLTLPPHLAAAFHDVTGLPRDEYFCTSDPQEARLGSGGGTTWLLEAARRADPDCSPSQGMEEWLPREKRILLHGGGESRRLPAYAPSGKVLTPLPVFRWARGQRLSQTLLSLQMPFYERVMHLAPASCHTLIASGDVLLRCPHLPAVPEADVVVYGLWAEAGLAQHHGVFCLSRDGRPLALDFMLQKPTPERLAELSQTHLYLMDVGLWLLSDRAVRLLSARSHDAAGRLCRYDLYGEFGCALGLHPTVSDPELATLTVRVVPLDDATFYHYGTTPEMIASTTAVQNLVLDQRAILHLGVKPHPSIFTQNARCEVAFSPSHHDIWIENSHVGALWTLESENVITGVPANAWALRLAAGQCVDIVPIGERGYAVRPYGFHDTFRGSLSSGATRFLSLAAPEWLRRHGLSAADVEGSDDLQHARLFPLVDDVETMGEALAWMLGTGGSDRVWRESRRLSADEISREANLGRLVAQRRTFRGENLCQLAANHRRSVFYQLNLEDAAVEMSRQGLPVPSPLDPSEALLKRISDQMFRSRLFSLRGDKTEAATHKTSAFRLLREGLTSELLCDRQSPRLDVYPDQIVWARSPVRIDLAGGWTDTPPYCLTNGGAVVNLAVCLGGQPPLQAYVRPSREYKFKLHSIDLGATEEICTYEELRAVSSVGSPFAIPKAALCLAGFLPPFSLTAKATLEEQLREMGGGLELTLMSGVARGSGLGTSSILAATVLAAVSAACGLGWDKTEICRRTLVLEQLLTTGGGWQDQYGGVLGGLKLLRTTTGFDQTPEVRWLPETLYTDPLYRPLHLLYYTGLTRTAKAILADIVRNMFLSETDTLRCLSEMKDHAMTLYTACLKGDFEALGRSVGVTWEQNKHLDRGTNPPEVEAVVRKVEDLCLGLKLPGAGGGGYLYMVAKDAEAAARIRRLLAQEHTPTGSRFVEMSLSREGLQVSRS